MLMVCRCASLPLLASGPERSEAGWVAALFSRVGQVLFDVEVLNRVMSKVQCLECIRSLTNANCSYEVTSEQSTAILVTGPGPWI